MKKIKQTIVAAAMLLGVSQMGVASECVELKLMGGPYFNFNVQQKSELAFTPKNEAEFNRYFHMCKIDKDDCMNQIEKFILGQQAKSAAVFDMFGIGERVCNGDKSCKSLIAKSLLISTMVSSDVSIVDFKSYIKGIDGRHYFSYNPNCGVKKDHKELYDECVSDLDCLQKLRNFVTNNSKYSWEMLATMEPMNCACKQLLPEITKQDFQNDCVVALARSSIGAQYSGENSICESIDWIK